MKLTLAMPSTRIDPKTGDGNWMDNVHYMFHVGLISENFLHWGLIYLTQ